MKGVSLVFLALVFLCGGALAGNDTSYAGLAEVYAKILKEREAAQQRLEKEQEERRKAYEEEQQKLKAEFGFTFNDVLHNLVVIKHDDGAGSGFVARIDGQRYLLTNQHVILGASGLSFKTLGGETLRPKKIELAASRDIARLLLDEGDGLGVSNAVGIDVPIAVFGNSEGAGVATELYGKTTGVGADVLEVSAEFVKGNSGSPLLNTDGEVLGIASYVMFSPARRDTEGTKFESQTRRFCYKITGADWQEVNWRKFNRDYGEPYAESVRFVEDVQSLLSGMNQYPPQVVNAAAISDSLLQKWPVGYNEALKNIRKSQGVHDYQNSMEELGSLCQKHAWRLRTRIKQRKFGGFVLSDLETKADYLESLAKLLQESFQD